MGTSAEFWRDQKKWPQDTPEMVFLARAVDQLGRVIFKEEWTGREPHAEIFSAIQIAVDKRDTNNFIARHLPQFGRKIYDGSMAPPPTGHPEYRPEFDFTAEEMAALGAFIAQNNETATKARERFRKVQGAIADFAVSGQLGTGFRALVGGEIHPIPKAWWHSERLEFRFASCGINPDRPFEKGGNAFIFVSRVDLEKVLQQLAPQATSNDVRKCAKWLEEQFLQDPDVVISKTTFRDRAKEIFEIGTKPFNRAWDKATETRPERNRAVG